MDDLPKDGGNSQKLPKHKTVHKTEVILTGAMQEFMTTGYAAASMDRIAVAAGVSKPTLYSYFRDKAGLFAALVQQIVKGDRKPKLLELLDDDNLLQMPLREGLRQIATVVLKQLSGEQPLFNLIRLIIGESGRFPLLAQTFVRNAQKPLLEQLSYLFAHHPDFKGTDPEVAARCFHGSIVFYIIIQEILHGRDILPMERDRFINGLINLIVGEESHNAPPTESDASHNLEKSPDSKD